jgi:hypothetical protein
MAESNGNTDSSTTEPAWIRRNWKSTWIFGTIDLKMDLESGLRTRPAAGMAMDSER